MIPAPFQTLVRIAKDTPGVPVLLADFNPAFLPRFFSFAAGKSLGRFSFCLVNPMGRVVLSYADPCTVLTADRTALAKAATAVQIGYGSDIWGEGFNPQLSGFPGLCAYKGSRALLVPGGAQPLYLGCLGVSSGAAGDDDPLCQTLADFILGEARRDPGAVISLA
ncbi:heme-binding protein [Niveispirillum sp. KHB5.9]|uniref:heme-binding protein n=1 Tax=Niveispirillum sp. KHB5.9 TaxID=3400269 RepID=UPI003A88854B